MPENAVTKILKTHLDETMYEFGYADLTGLLSKEYSSYNHGISILRHLEDTIIDSIGDGPTADYYIHYVSVNRELNRLVTVISDELSSIGIGNRPVKATVDDSELDEAYFKHLLFNFSHKLVATRAGLGWIGKTDLLISKRFGPRVRLASIVTDRALTPIGVPIEKSQCGTCAVCINHCPGHAANGKLWDTTVGRNEFFDPFKCREYCRYISKEKLDKIISLCGMCVHVCPKGR
jgi:epoxyqueuosine reductase